jgi:hypothetical protein
MSLDHPLVYKPDRSNWEKAIARKVHNPGHFQYILSLAAQFATWQRGAADVSASWSCESISIRPACQHG